MITTTNYGLSKPELTDKVGATILALANNFGTLDGLDNITSKVLDYNGYIAFKSGLIIQWGRNTVPSGAGVHVTFLKPYTTACYLVMPMCATSAIPFNLPKGMETTTGFNVAFGGGTVQEVHWISIGK